MCIPRLDRSLVLEILGPFLASLVFLSGLLLALQMLRGIDVVLGAGVRLLDLARVLGCLAPHFLTMAMPVSFLFALLLVMGRWSEDREVLALAAVGMAPWRLWLAPLALALVIGGVGVVLGHGPEPRGLASLRQNVNQLIKRNMAMPVGSSVTGRPLTAASPTASWRARGTTASRSGQSQPRSPRSPT